MGGVGGWGLSGWLAGWLGDWVGGCVAGWLGGCLGTTGVCERERERESGERDRERERETEREGGRGRGRRRGRRGGGRGGRGRGRGRGAEMERGRRGYVFISGVSVRMLLDKVLCWRRIYVLRMLGLVVLYCLYMHICAYSNHAHRQSSAGRAVVRAQGVEIRAGPICTYIHLDPPPYKSAHVCRYWDVAVVGLGGLERQSHSR